MNRVFTGGQGKAGIADYPTFFLAGKIVEYFAQVLPELTIEHFSPAFRYPHHMELAIPFCVA
jgi:hypothetical protein